MGKRIFPKTAKKRYTIDDVAFKLGVQLNVVKTWIAIDKSPLFPRRNKPKLPAPFLRQRKRFYSDSDIEQFRKVQEWYNTPIGQKLIQEYGFYSTTFHYRAKVYHEIEREQKLKEKEKIVAKAVLSLEKLRRERDIKKIDGIRAAREIGKKAEKYGFKEIPLPDGRMVKITTSKKHTLNVTKLLKRLHDKYPKEVVDSVLDYIPKISAPKLNHAIKNGKISREDVLEFCSETAFAHPTILICKKGIDKQEKV